MKDFNAFKYQLVFQKYINIADILNGTINIFDMLELIEQFKIYNIGEKYLRSIKNGK